MTRMQAVIYCRVSTKEQTHNLSLPTQLKACRDYCAGKGLVVAKEFLEAGESAKTADRTQLRALLAYCRENKGRVHALIVYNISRFARDRFDHVVIRAQLQKLGVTLRSVNEPIDDSSTGRLMEGIVSAFAQFDNDQKAERTAAGMQAALQLGRWTFKAPLGYVNARTKSGPSLLPDPLRAHLVRFANGTSSVRSWRSPSWSSMTLASIKPTSRAF
jgi:DNA invertase Pin-like site-specific DNA recombinase